MRHCHCPIFPSLCARYSHDLCDVPDESLHAIFTSTSSRTSLHPHLQGLNASLRAFSSSAQGHVCKKKKGWLLQRLSLNMRPSRTYLFCFVLLWYALLWTKRTRRRSSFFCHAALLMCHSEVFSLLIVPCCVSCPCITRHLRLIRLLHVWSETKQSPPNHACNTCRRKGSRSVTLIV